MKPLRILFSAYACEPGKGSEPGVGWRWALEAARLGHKVWVITRENNAPGIERGLSDLAPGMDLNFVYYDLPPSMRKWKKGARGVHLYYVLWQWGAARRARKLHAEQRFDAVHHITFGVARHPSFMGNLGVPFVLGPVGAGESAPLGLRRHFPWAGYMRDGARDVANVAARFDPTIRAMFRNASVVLLKTRETLRWLPAGFRDKAHCMLEIGIDSRANGDSHARPVPQASAALHLVYVGRFVYLKGVALGIRAIAMLKDKGVKVNLTLIGQGPELEEWKALVDSLGIDDQVHWVPWMPQAELLDSYRTYDAMLFPSLRDSSGNVVLEAMSSGLPVVCLGLGGPAEMVDQTCGRVVDAIGRTESQVIEGIASALAELADTPSTRARLRDGALKRAAEFEWANVVARVWGPKGLGCRAVAQHSMPMGGTVMREGPA